MKLRRIGAAFSSAILAFSSLLTLAVPGVVHAAGNTCTWTGATDLKFSTAGNWTNCGGVAPQNGDNLVFDITSLTADATLNNDLTGLSTGTMTFSGSNAGYYKYIITGNALTLGGDITDSADVNNDLDLDVSLGTDVTVTNTGTTYGLGFGNVNDTTAHTLDTQGHSLTIGGSGADCGLTVFNKLVGAGNFTSNLSNGGVYLDANSDTFTGGVTVNGGVLILDQNAGLGNTSGVIVNAGSLALTMAQDKTFNFPLSLSGSGVSQYDGTLIANGSFGFCGGGGGPAVYTATLSGPVTLNSDITYSGAFNTKVTGTYTDNGHKVTNLAGSTGTFTAGGSTTQVTLSQRTIAATDSQPTQQEYANSGEELTLDGVRGDTEVAGGGVLKGTGTVGQLTVDQNGIVAPGHSPGCMTVTGGLKEYGTYQAEIGGTDPCTGYDQLKVTGAVDLGGSNGNAQGILSTSLYNGFKPAAGQSYTIIDNDGTDAVQGTFANLAEGATFKVDNYVFAISYKGGDGNDVVLSVKTVPSTPDTGFALISANPLASLVATTIAAAAILVIAQKTRTNKVAVRRRR